MLRILSPRLLWLGLLLGILQACGIEKNKMLSPDAPVFKTTDPTRLFFKNTRQIYYDRQEIGRDRLEVYRKKDRNTDSSIYSLNLLIGNNWMHDEAYIRFESASEEMLPAGTTIKWQEGEANGLYRLESNTKESHFALATQLYQAILKKQSLFVIQDSKEIPVLHTQDQRETFRITMIDFYRLVGLM